MDRNWNRTLLHRDRRAPDLRSRFNQMLLGRTQVESHPKRRGAPCALRGFRSIRDDQSVDAIREQSEPRNFLDMKGKGGGVGGRGREVSSLVRIRLRSIKRFFSPRPFSKGRIAKATIEPEEGLWREGEKKSREGVEGNSRD